jgi:hypothetical protein
MNRVIALCCVLSLSSSWAASPTTKPANARPMTFQELQAEVVRLRVEIEALKKELSEIRLLNSPAAGATTKPQPRLQTKQARDFKPGNYRIYHVDGNTYIVMHCDTLDDALRYAANKHWPLMILYDAEDGSPFYPGIIKTDEEPKR